MISLGGVVCVYSLCVHSRREWSYCGFPHFFRLLCWTSSLLVDGPAWVWYMSCLWGHPPRDVHASISSCCSQNNRTVFYFPTAGWVMLLATGGHVWGTTCCIGFHARWCVGCCISFHGCCCHFLVEFLFDVMVAWVKFTACCCSCCCVPICCAMSFMSCYWIVAMLAVTIASTFCCCFLLLVLSYHHGIHALFRNCEDVVCGSVAWLFNCLHPVFKLVGCRICLPHLQVLLPLKFLQVCVVFIDAVLH